MNNRTKNLLYWIPRAFGILFALFISAFALDVFGEGYGLSGTIVALLMHLIPTALVVIALSIAWRWERAGALLFFGLAVFYAIMTDGASLLISAPLLLIGIFFLIDSAYLVQLAE